MKLIVVYIEKMRKAPPVVSFIKVLSELGNDVVVCGIKEGSETYNDILWGEGVRTYYVSNEYEGNTNLVYKYFRMLKIRRRLWEIIEKEYEKNTVIIAIADVSIKHLGKRLLEKKFVLYMLELQQNIYYIPRLKMFKIPIERYANAAKAIIEAEYNRAQITKAWWRLDNLPFVLPNKPYFTDDIVKNNIITISDLPSNFTKLLGKKIIIYQGNINGERPLEKYLSAIKELGDEYAFVVMGSGEDPFVGCEYENYSFLPFITPPLHLQITSHAYIGIISYKPVENENSILNVLYCAPNKIWEYSKFGIPVISNDLPALRVQYSRYHNGICVEENENSIYDGFKQIIDNYEGYSNGANEFYKSVDLKRECEKIFGRINEQK